MLEIANENDDLNTTPQDENNDSLLRARIDSDFIVNDITVYPLIYCVEEDALYTINEIYRRQHRWTDNQPRFDMLYLTSEKTADFFGDILAGMNTIAQQTGKTYQFIGWMLSTEVYMQAQDPRYLKWTPSQGCIEGTAERKRDVPYQYATLKINEYFRVYAEDINAYKYWGINGAWYYLYPNYQLGGQMITSGFAIHAN